jgi:hypothetical protein
MHLATITSQEENDFIVDEILPNSEKYYYWLGGTDEKVEGTWEWVTGEEWNYENWYDPQPDNAYAGTEHYLEINNYISGTVIGYWNDLQNFNNNRLHGIICENSNPNSIFINAGWNLISLNEDLENISEEISIIWQWNQDWSAFSPNGEFSSRIASEGISEINESLNSNDGVWFLSKSDFHLELSENNSTETPEFPNLHGELGWNLMGATVDMHVNALRCDDGEVDIVWKFVDGNWKHFVHDVNVDEFPQSMFDTIYKNEGFWLLCN